jgi:Pentapeptide repeats (8 copies)
MVCEHYSPYIANSDEKNSLTSAYNTMIQEGNQHKRISETPCVSIVRDFFDYKAEKFNFKKDKMSQAYIFNNLTEEELYEYIFQNFTEDSLDNYQLNLSDLKIMFQAYCESSKYIPHLIFEKVDWNLRSFADVGNLIRIYILYVWIPTLLNPVISVGAIIGLVGLVSTCREAEKQQYVKALETISNTDGGNNTVRKEAIEYLTRDVNKNPILLGSSSLLFYPPCKRNNSCLEGIKLRKVNLMKFNLRGVNFNDTELDNVNFRNVDLTGASFQNADLSQSIFFGANLTRVDLTSAKNVGPGAFARAKFCNTTMPNGDVKMPNCR